MMEISSKAKSKARGNEDGRMGQSMKGSFI